MYSHTILIGRVGQAPQEKNTKGGNTYVALSLATSETYKDKATGERKENTCWHNLIIWPEGLRKVATQYVNKGDLLTITGTIQNRSWQDDADNWHNRSEITVRELRPMPNGKKTNDPGPTEPPKNQSPDQNLAAELNDDVPF